jgi:hypothetical protein
MAAVELGNVSTDRRLQDWLEELVARADLDPLGAGSRIREVVGTRRARIGLDDEWVIVFFDGDDLGFSDDISLPLDGSGSTTSEVVLGVLGSSIEATEAIENGLIEVNGEPEEVVRMFQVIELLLDASARVPELRALADDFLRSRAGLDPVMAPPSTSPIQELELLRRLGVDR